MDFFPLLQHALAMEAYLAQFSHPECANEEGRAGLGEVSEAQQLELDRLRAPAPSSGVGVRLLAAQEAWELGVPATSSNSRSRELSDFKSQLNKQRAEFIPRSRGGSSGCSSRSAAAVEKPLPRG